MDTDEALYRRVLGGDTAAFEELVSRHHTPLFQFLYRLMNNTTAAEDLLQETFTRLVTFQGAPPQNFRAWAYKIAHNLARDYFRSAYVRHETTAMLDEDCVDADSLDVEHRALGNIEHEEIQNILLRLSPEHREVVILRFYHDLKVEEIAESVGISVGTAKSRLFYALRSLKMILAVTGRRIDRLPD